MALYSEHQLLYLNEVQVTRPTGFLWQTYPSVLESQAAVSLSDLVQGVPLNKTWFDNEEAIVPAFNPSLATTRDGSLLVTLRRANRAGCPQLSSRHADDSMNDILLVVLCGAHLSRRAVAIVWTPWLGCAYTPSMAEEMRLPKRVAGSVSGPADARIFRAADESLWVLFFAEVATTNNRAKRGQFLGRLRLGPDAGWRTCERATASGEQLQATIAREELLELPGGTSHAEKNWNILRIIVEGDAHVFYIEYRLEPHVVLRVRASYDRGALRLTDVTWLGGTRWGKDIFHGLSDIRGSTCCVPLPPGGDISPELHGALLGVGHMQRRRNSQAAFDERSLGIRGSVVYTHFFYALRGEAPFDIIAVSAEWCVAARGRYSMVEPGSDACEAVQMVTGMQMWRPGILALTYGINDCEGALLPLLVSVALMTLRPTSSHGINLTGGPA